MPFELRRAAILCFENAKDLLDEAEILRTRDRPARAYALAAVGFEELGKARVCAALIAKDPDYAEYEDNEVFWRFWKDHVKKGTRVFLQTTKDSRTVYRFSDSKRAEDIARSLKLIRERGLYVNIRENRPPQFPGDPEPPPVRKWSMRFQPPNEMCDDYHARELVRDLSSHLHDLSPRIEELREVAEADFEKFSIEFRRRWAEAKRAREEAQRGGEEQ